jgi:FlaA1/EpsC-like NDP-sugar epimerase
MTISKLKIFVFNIIDKKIKTLGYMPRWIILFIDLLIVLFSTILTILLLHSFNNRYFNSINISLIVVATLVVNAIFFIFHKTYSGIIRHSTFIDGSKLLVATLWSFSVLAGYNYAWAFFHNGQKIFITSGIFIDHALIFIFEMFLNAKNSQNLMRVIIFGADANAISVANALKSEVSKRFSLVGFINNISQNTSSKSILNIPIYNFNKPLIEILNSANANSIIITEKNLTNSEKIAIVEECLENNIKVYTIPKITDWQDSSQISNQISSFNIEDLLERSPIVLATDKISEQIQEKTILISGAAGSIGSEITRQLINFQPKKIIILDQAETPLHELRLELDKLKLKIKIRNILVDIRDFEALDKVFDVYKPEIVYHAAAYKHVPMIEENPAQAVFTNIIGTKNIADLSQKY